MKRWLLISGITFIVLEMVDAFLTLWAVGYGGYIETNGVIQTIINTSLWLLPLVKFIIPSLYVALTVWLCQRYPQATIMGIFFLASGSGIYAGAMVHNIGVMI